MRLFFVAFLLAVSAAADPQCCLPWDTLAFTGSNVVASWDVAGSHAGWTTYDIQIDYKNHLLYTIQQKATPTPKLQQLEMWLTPGNLQGQWFQFIRIDGRPECYSQTLTTMPAPFYKQCFGAPYHTYKGDAVVGTQTLAVFDAIGARANTTTFVQPSACIPANSIALGFFEDTDWQEKQELYLNYREHIDHPEKFLPPTGCKPMLQGQSFGAFKRPILPLSWNLEKPAAAAAKN